MAVHCSLLVSELSRRRHWWQQASSGSSKYWTGPEQQKQVRRFKKVISFTCQKCKKLFLHVSVQSKSANFHHICYISTKMYRKLIQGGANMRIFSVSRARQHIAKLSHQLWRNDKLRLNALTITSTSDLTLRSQEYLVLISISECYYSWLPFIISTSTSDRVQ